MNRIYRPVWNAARRSWQVTGEIGRRRCKMAGEGSSRLRLIALGGALLAGPAIGADLPSGGTVVSGQGGIHGSDDTLTVEQHSQNLVLDWQSFSVGEGHTVRFHQPNAQAAALNRVSGDQVSQIRGALRANGRVFLVNPNGVMFSATAQVDVGSLVASTLDISTEDFMAGNYRFEGASANAVINRGNITTAEGGMVAMIAAEIINTGRISTPGGSTLMGAGSKLTLDLGGPVKIEVEEALLDTYIEQGGAIRADGGLVYLTARAAGGLASSVINHSGVTEARTLATGENGRIMLMGDMDRGELQVAGTLDASAPVAGDGGFIETSAARVQIDGVDVNTHARGGATGEWLIDPVDITVAASGGNVTGSDLAAALATTNVTLDTSASGSCAGVTCSGLAGTAGNIFVNDDIRVATGGTDTTLTLKANRNVIVDAGVEISSSSGKLHTVFWARANATADDVVGSIWLKQGSSVSTNGGDIIIGGGLDPQTDYALGDRDINGLTGENNAVVRGASINGNLDAGGGDISIRGKGNASGSARGVSVSGDIRTQGSGNIAIYGQADGGSDAIAVGDSHWSIADNAGSITAGTGTVYLSGQQAGSEAIYVNSGSHITSSGLVVLDGQGGEIRATDNNYLSASEVLVFDSNDVQLDSSLNDWDTLAATQVGNFTVRDMDPFTVGAVNWEGSDYAGVQASGVVDMATLSGDLSVNEDVYTSSTSSVALILNSGLNASAGTRTGGDIRLNGASIDAAGGTRLYTGSLAGSNGVIALLGTGSGRFRYNSDEVDSNYAAALGQGRYAIFREQPMLSVSPEAVSMVYGEAQSGYTASYSGLVNDDSSPQMSGTAAWATAAGATSASAHRVVGSYDVAYNGGLASALGYGFADDTGSLAELTVNKRALSLVLSGTTSRVYDGSNDIGFSGYTVTPTGGLGGDALTVDTGSLTGFVDKHVGINKPVTFTGFALSGADAGNYQLVSGATGSNAEITPRPLTVYADPQQKLAGQPDPTLSYRSDCGAATGECGLVSGEALQGTLSREAGNSAGTYRILQGTVSGANNPNYLIDYMGADLVILTSSNPADIPTNAARAVDAVQQTAGSLAGITGFQPAGNRTAPGLSGGLEVVELNGQDAPRADVPRAANNNSLGPLRLFVVDGGIRSATPTQE